MSPARKRADIVLVERGLFESRNRARAAIEAGHVIADGRPLTRPSDPIAPDAVLQAEPAHPFVSRGGVKLEGALERYPLPIENRVCLDIGASTGGFSQVLLQRGAAKVYAIDVGRGQLHPSLAGEERLVSLEQTDIRSLDASALPQRPAVIVIDVSFISLKAVLPAALSLAATPATLLALIKPQFEAGRAHNKHGIVRDHELHRAICDDIADLAAALGCDHIATFPSPITGGDGNIEFFLGARHG